MSERLERVTAFSELRAGMIVVVSPCHVCRGRHRGILTAENRDAADHLPEGKVRFQVYPPPPCAIERGFPNACIPEETIFPCGLFKVVDGLEEPSTETAAATGTTRRTPQKERAR